jgi:hypothetical protein
MLRGGHSRRNAQDVDCLWRTRRGVVEQGIDEKEVRAVPRIDLEDVVVLLLPFNH